MDLPLHRYKSMTVMVTYLVFVAGLAFMIWSLLVEYRWFTSVPAGILLLGSIIGFWLHSISFLAFGFIVLGLLLKIADLVIPTLGFLTLIGVASFVWGSLHLFPEGELSVLIVWSGSIFLVIYLITLGFIYTLKFPMLNVGNRRMIGKEARVTKKLNPEGVVYLEDELWTALLEANDTVSEGEYVQVEAIHDDKFIVRPILPKKGS